VGLQHLDNVDTDTQGINEDHWAGIKMMSS